MASTDGIDVVPFHGDDVLQHLAIIGHSSKTPAELMPVDTLKYNTLPVERHDTIVHRKTPKADFLRYDFDKISIRIIQSNQ